MSDPCCEYCDNHPEKKCPAKHHTFISVENLVQKGGVIIEAAIRMPDGSLRRIR